MSEPENPTKNQDDLDQIEKELRVLWLALGNEQHASEYLVDIGEHVNGLANRVREVSDRLQRSA